MIHTLTLLLAFQYVNMKYLFELVNISYFCTFPVALVAFSFFDGTQHICPCVNKKQTGYHIETNRLTNKSAPNSTKKEQKRGKDAYLHTVYRVVIQIQL